MYSSTISSAGGDTFMMANYLQMCLESADNFFELNKIRQKPDESLMVYIKRICTKKAMIPNVPVHRRDPNLTLTASDCFAHVDEYDADESNVVNLHGGKGKEPKRDQGNQSGSKNNKRNVDNLVTAVG